MIYILHITIMIIKLVLNIDYYKINYKVNSRYLCSYFSKKFTKYGIQFNVDISKDKTEYTIVYDFGEK